MLFFRNTGWSSLSAIFSYVVITSLAEGRREGPTDITDWPANPRALGRCMDSLILKLGIVMPTNIFSVRLVVKNQRLNRSATQVQIKTRVYLITPLNNTSLYLVFISLLICFFNEMCQSIYHSNASP
jgi:hypothetical protein